MNDVSAIIMEIGNNGEWGIGNGDWGLEIGEWEDLPLAVGLYSRKRS